ncbi:MAG TPA: hypothetical protein VE999_05800 [Gemmataceae bacterium]|nr:hypothetical protein [Gemmataceae bacterium]
MTTQPIYLVDESETRIAELNVSLIDGRYRGTICLDATPSELKQLFEEFEEAVEGQMFTLADEIEERIGANPLKVVFPNGREAGVEDLQVYPSTKRVSFKLREASKAAG